MQKSNIHYRIILAIAGFLAMGTGIYMSVVASLGTFPWAVLDVGISTHVPLTVGRIGQLVGFSIIIASFALGIKPQLGTFMNMFFVGFFYDLVSGSGFVPLPTTIGTRFLYLILGLIIFGTGTGLYIAVNIGAGPRDGLMLGLAQKLHLSIQVTRSTLELLVVGLGYLLGGPVGTGTVFMALAGGPVVQRSLQLWQGFITPYLDGVPVPIVASPSSHNR